MQSCCSTPSLPRWLAGSSASPRRHWQPRPRPPCRRRASNQRRAWCRRLDTTIVDATIIITVTTTIAATTTSSIIGIAIIGATIIGATIIATTTIIIIGGTITLRKTIPSCSRLAIACGATGCSGLARGIGLIVVSVTRGERRHEVVDERGRGEDDVARRAGLSEGL